MDRSLSSSSPYTFVVAALLLLLVTLFVLIRTPTDVLPSINIPVVSIIWSFNGLSAREIEQRMVYTEEPSELVMAHLHMDKATLDAIPKNGAVVTPLS